MTVVAYWFEAKAIQSYLFAGGKLKEVVNASELLDYLCKAPLDRVLHQVGLRERQPDDGPLRAGQIDFSRRSGGAFYAFLSEDAQAERLARLWSYTVRQLAPGLETVQALIRAESLQAASQQAEQALRQHRHLRRAELPPIHPLAERAPRTGQAVVAATRPPGEPVVAADPRHEWLDADMQIKRAFTRPVIDAEGAQSLARRCLPGRLAQHYYWPNNVEPDAPAQQRFPFGNQGRQLASVHIDGNGVGALLLRLKHAAQPLPAADYLRLFRTFSDGLEQATIAAMRQASGDVILPAATPLAQGAVLPARPLVLGGDDVTLLIRADLAIHFCRTFICAFEAETRTFLSELKQAYPQLDALPEKLTASGGIIYHGATAPFEHGQQLAEALTRQAKALARQAQQGRLPWQATPLTTSTSTSTSTSTPQSSANQTQASSDTGHQAVPGLPPSTLSLMRLSDLPACGRVDAFGHYATPQGQYQLTPGTWLINSNTAGLPQLDALLTLQRAFADNGLSSNPFRRALGQPSHPLAGLHATLMRWRDLLEKQQLSKVELALKKAYEQALADIGHQLGLRPRSLSATDGTEPAPSTLAETARWFWPIPAPHGKTSRHYLSMLADLLTLLAIHNSESERP